MKRFREWFAGVRSRTGAFAKRYFAYLMVAGFILLFLLVYFSNQMFVTIKPGELGVMWQMFGGGTTVHTVYREGLHFVMPYNRMYVYNTRRQRVADSIDVLTVDGLMVHVEYSVRFSPNPDLLPLLHQKIGPDYLNVVVRPEVRSVIRTVFGQYKPEEIYTTQKAIQERVSVQAKVRSEARFVSIDDVPIERICLPDQVANAIENKKAQQQLNEEYDYRLKVANKEAERKRIDAAGQKDYNQTVGRSLTPMLMEWHGIQATADLAKSTNSKVVIVGGKNGLPLILGKE